MPEFYKVQNSLGSMKGFRIAFQLKWARPNQSDDQLHTLSDQGQGQVCAWYKTVLMEFTDDNPWD